MTFNHDLPIATNSVKCLVCDDIITSLHRHDFKYCKCGNVAVDGGRAYLKRCYSSDNWQELSTNTPCHPAPCSEE